MLDFMLLLLYHFIMSLCKKEREREAIWWDSGEEGEDLCGCELWTVVMMN